VTGHIDTSITLDASCSLVPFYGMVFFRAGLTNPDVQVAVSVAPIDAHNVARGADQLSKSLYQGKPRHDIAEMSAISMSSALNGL
jgi:hypothetical protein